MKPKFLLAIAVLAVFAAISSSCSGQKEDSQAKYVFLFIGDGMGHSHVDAAESYLSYKEGKLGGEQLTFTGFPVFGTCTSYSADSHITCSSAAGTAIATGHKTNNRSLGVDTDGAPLKSMAYALKEQGYKIGIISSVPVNHATPASFYAHNKDRGDYYSIAQEIAASDFDFLGGAGFLHFNGKDGSQEDIDKYLNDSGYKVCFGEEELEDAAEKYSKIVFSQESGRQKQVNNYSFSGNNPKDIELDELLENTVEFLGDEKPFFIMCEGGAIDWAAHSNYTMETINQILKFDEAVEYAYEFYLKHPDETLIVVTADHETGGIALGNTDNHSRINWNVFEEGSDDDYVKEPDAKTNKELNRAANIGWTTDDHTGGAVPVYAIGVGAGRFGGRIDNTDIFGKIVLKK